MKMPVLRAPFLFVFLFLVAWPVAAQNTAAPAQDSTAMNAQTEAAARQAAEDWLAHVDAGDYVQSWEEAAAMLQDQISQAKWAQALGNAQAQTDTLQDRAFASARHASQLSGVPEGEYVIVQYRSDYGNGSAQETVLLTLEEDAWKVAGYAVRPAGQGQQ